MSETVKSFSDIERESADKDRKAKEDARWWEVLKLHLGRSNTRARAAASRADAAIAEAKKRGRI